MKEAEEGTHYVRSNGGRKIMMERDLMVSERKGGEGPRDRMLNEADKEDTTGEKGKDRESERERRRREHNMARVVRGKQD